MAGERSGIEREIERERGKQRGVGGETGGARGEGSRQRWRELEGAYLTEIVRERCTSSAAVVGEEGEIQRRLMPSAARGLGRRRCRAVAATARGIRRRGVGASSDVVCCERDGGEDDADLSGRSQEGEDARSGRWQRIATHFPARIFSLRRRVDGRRVADPSVRVVSAT
ncbi:hypothetical protein ACLOJK_025083 [Asimina triloba]